MNSRDIRSSGDDTKLTVHGPGIGYTAKSSNDNDDDLLYACASLS